MLKQLKKYLESLPDHQLEQIADGNYTVMEDRLRPRVILLEHPLLTEDEIAKALSGNSSSLLYRAIVSKIQSTREENLLEASRAASAGNTLAMAGGLNAYEALTGLLYALDEYVNKTKD